MSRPEFAATYDFPKRMRLRKRRDYLAAQNHEHRSKLHSRHFLVIVAPRDDFAGIGCAGRVGITVSKKVGNAVVRNRIKRWVREFARSHHAWLPERRDVVVIAKRDAANLDRQGQVGAELASLEGRWPR